MKDKLENELGKIRKKRVFDENFKTVKLSLNDSQFELIKELGFDSLFEIIEKYPPRKKRKTRNFKLHKDRIKRLRNIKYTCNLSFTEIFLYACRKYALLNQYNHFGIFDKNEKRK